MMISETLKMLRIINGMTGKDLSKNLGISASYLSEIENGKKDPAMYLLEKYSDMFEIKLSSLLLFIEELQADQAKKSSKIKTKDMFFRFMWFLDSIDKDNAQFCVVDIGKVSGMRKDVAG